MSVRIVDFAEGEFYHVYNRGTDKRPLFMSDSDYKRFVGLLFLSNSSKSINYRDIENLHTSIFEFEKNSELVFIGAYCLMPNHFHILLTPKVDNGVTEFMHKLGTSYSMYFNKKYDRTGTLFEGRFKAKYVSYDEYFKYLYAYIHLNPLKLMPTLGTTSPEEVLTFLKNYKYSSLPDYLNINREEGKILNPAPFPEYFQTSASHISELKTWLEFNPDKINLK